MGYTHYFNTQKEILPGGWDEILSMFTTIDTFAKSEGIEIQYEGDIEEPPQADSDCIGFNGKDDDAHETFILSRMPDTSFNFCKTANKPYDLIVCLTLLAAYFVAGKTIEISSDGDWANDWNEAREVFTDLFGIDPHKPPRIQETY